MMIPQPLSQLGDLARRPGRRVLCSPKTAAPSISNATVASPAAPCLELSTGIALAFPRGPFVPAAAAWELQEATSGKFQLGLGTQVRKNVVHRYGMAFHRPGPRLRYLLAVKACFAVFQTGTPDHHGEFDNPDFITAQWSPARIDPPRSQPRWAAVNPWMRRGGRRGVGRGRVRGDDHADPGADEHP